MRYGRDRQGIHEIILLEMCFACWLEKARNTQAEYDKLIAFPRQQYLQHRTKMLRLYEYVSRLSCFGFVFKNVLLI